jgi:hypothetical protein
VGDQARIQSPRSTEQKTRELAGRTDGDQFIQIPAVDSMLAELEQLKQIIDEWAPHATRE